MWDHLWPILFSWQAPFIAAALAAFAFAAGGSAARTRARKRWAGSPTCSCACTPGSCTACVSWGRENIPPRRGHGPIVLVANHHRRDRPDSDPERDVAEVRFLMARDMQPTALKDLWEWIGVIPVSRDGPTRAPHARRSAGSRKAGWTGTAE